MVDFKLSDEQRQYQKLAYDFVQEQIATRAAQYDHSGDFAMDICRHAWELGLMNVCIPEEYGGLGLSTFDACLIAEEIGAGCTGMGAALQANNMAQAPLIVAGTHEQKQEYLKVMTDEFCFACYCVNESGSGLDVEGVTTKAIEDGADYVVSGQKRWITNASMAKWYYVLAGGVGEQDGVSAFIIPGDAPGVVVGERQMTLGRKASDVRNVSFEEVRIPKRNLLGKLGQGEEITRLAWQRSGPLVASAAVGLARSAMEHSIRYAKERSTFGTPIANHQAISFMLADMAKNIEAARLIAYRAAWLVDNAMDSDRQAAIARAFAVDTAMAVTIDAVQVFGGYGYSREYPVEKLMRDAKMSQICEGNSQIQKVAIANQLVGV